MNRRLVGLATGLVGLAVLLTACDSQGEAANKPRSSSSPDLVTIAPEVMPPGVRLSFIQNRFDEGTQRAQVRVLNGSKRPVRVREIGIDWAGFRGGLQRADYPVPGRSVIDLPYLLPRADCSARAGRDEMYAVATTKDRTVRQVLPADGVRFLSRVWREECTTRRIERTVDISYDLAGTEEGTELEAVRHASLVLTRKRTDREVTVDQVQGSVLFELAVSGDLSLPDDARRTTIALDVSPGRCDEHGRSQSTQTFVFRVWIRLDDGEPLARVVTPSRGQQTRLLAFLDRACGGLTAH